MLNWIVAGLHGVNGQAVVFYVGVVLRHASEIVTIQRQSPAEDLARELPKFFNRVTLQRYVLVSICLLKKGTSINISSRSGSGYTGAHQMEPPSPITSHWSQPFPE